jgi:hypothetical protein
MRATTSDTTAAHRLKQMATKAIDERSSDLIRLSRAIHATPELAFHEHRSAAAVKAAAEHGGLRVQEGAFGIDTALVSEFGRSGPLVALLSEYDALPGIGHACGHSRRVPSLHPLIASAPQSVRIHDASFTQWAASELGDKAVIDGAKALAMTAIDYCVDCALQDAAATAFHAHAALSLEAVDAAWDAAAGDRIGGAGCC